MFCHLNRKRNVFCTYWEGEVSILSPVRMSVNILTGLPSITSIVIIIILLFKITYKPIKFAKLKKNKVKHTDCILCFYFQTCHDSSSEVDRVGMTTNSHPHNRAVRLETKKIVQTWSTAKGNVLKYSRRQKKKILQVSWMPLS